MNLNLQIIKEELLSISFKFHYVHKATELSCAYPTIYSGEENLRGDVVYIAEAEKLPSKPVLKNIPSIICIKKPAQIYLEGKCNILYTEDEVSCLDLMNLLLETFHKYYNWETSMQNIIDKNLPLRELGKISKTFVNNPIYFHGAGFKCIFHIADDSNDNSSKLYQNYNNDYLTKENDYISLEEITLLMGDKEYNDAIFATQPTIYSAKLYGFRTLFYNIDQDNNYVARLCFAEVLNPFTDKDIAIIKILGEYLKKGIQGKDLDNYNRPKDLDEILNNLLSHHLVEELKIATVLHNFDWSINNDYLCMILETKTTDNFQKTLKATALQLSGILSVNCYSVFNDRIILIFNLTHRKITRNQLINIVIPHLRDNLFAAGISTVFNDFKNIYYYYEQSLIALELGKRVNPSYWYFRFEDYNLSYYISRCREQLIDEAIVPAGLKQLMKYDKKHNTSYTQLLKIYLENNMNIAETVRKAYLHRNTCLYRLERIRELLAMDLDDFDVRLTLMIGLKILF